MDKEQKPFTIAGMEVVITETPMTKEQYDRAINSLARHIADKYLEEMRQSNK